MLRPCSPGNIICLIMGSGVSIALCFYVQILLIKLPSSKSMSFFLPSIFHCIPGRRECAKGKESIWLQAGVNPLQSYLMIFSFLFVVDGSKICEEHVLNVYFNGNSLICTSQR